MEFVEVGYAYLVPLILLSSLIIGEHYRGYLQNILSAVNVSMLFFVVFACREYFGLYQLAKAFGFNLSAKGLLLLFSTNIPFVLKCTTTLLLPLLFLNKKLSYSPILSIVLVVLLWWDVLFAFFNHQTINLIGSNYLPLKFRLLKYISLLIGVYGFLWLTKRIKSEGIEKEAMIK